MLKSHIDLNSTSSYDWFAGQEQTFDAMKKHEGKMLRLVSHVDDIIIVSVQVHIFTCVNPHFFFFLWKVFLLEKKTVDF